MIDINEYIKKPLSERQAHLKLNEPCIERGGVKGMISYFMRGALAHAFDTTIPYGHKIYACHACNNDKCGNLYHLYWGTIRENCLDAINCGRTKSIWEWSIAKYGLEEARRRQGLGYKGKGGHAGKGKPKTIEHNKKVSDSIKLLHQQGHYDGVGLGRKKKEVPNLS